MTVKDSALESHRQLKQNNPYMSQPYVVLGKVIAVHSDTGKVDVAIDGPTHQGGIKYNVPILSWSYATQTGETYMPSNIKLASPVTSSVGVYDQPIPSGEQDVWCVIGFLNGMSQRPVCLGFLSPLDSQIHTKDPGWKVSLHESGVWSATDPQGNVTIGLPDGSTIILGQSTTPADMTAQNSLWDPQTTETPYNLTLNFNGNINITVNGTAMIDAEKVYIGTSEGGGNAVVTTASTVNLQTGAIENGSNKVFSG